MKKPTKRDFEKQFEENAADLLVLTGESLRGAGGYGDYLHPSVKFIACVDLKTGDLSREKGSLDWLIKNTPDHDWVFHFKQFEIYHVRARKSIPIKLQPYMNESINNRYMVVEVVEEKVSEPRLDKIRKRVAKPVRIEEAGLGSFELNREFSFFEGDIEWLGAVCGVALETDRADGATARRALAALKKLYAELGAWDERLRRYSAQALTGLANEWLREDAGPAAAPITEDAFAARMKISELSISPNGSMTVYYKDDNMFLGHIIIIEANISGEISDAAIAG